MTYTVKAVERDKQSRSGKTFHRLQLDPGGWVSVWEDLPDVSPGDTVNAHVKEKDGFKNAYDVTLVGSAPPRATSDEAEMRFVSNVVAHAIAAGKIEGPAQIGGWVAAARAALQPDQYTEDDPPPPDDPF